ncbi:MAG: hypothetical protein IJ439_01575 [Tyzzerella sp.]|nr:hypothetical protein [Tyzzerella sp.]
MAQFIQYLYEYENGKKVRNLGFMKVEKQMDKSVIQIYAKQLDEIMGILFQREDGSKYLAAWEACKEDESMCAEESRRNGGMMQAREPQCDGGMMQEEISQREEERGHTEKSQCKEQTCGVEQSREMLSQEKEREPVNVRQERPVREMQRSEMQRDEMQRDEMQRGGTHRGDTQEEEEVTSYIPPTSCRCEKIQRQDLSRLPRREWRLANNSFLLHGFYNYHHLLYIEEGDQTWIGVPGIFHEKEKMAANAFGFTKFIRPTDMDIDLSEDEKNTYEDFGYWCRQVAR